MDSTTMFSRSGRTDDGGKLVCRLDVALPEDLNDKVVACATLAGKPKAEFARDLISEALCAPMLIALPPDVRTQLTAMASLVGETPNDLALALLFEAVKRSFGMTQSFARSQVLRQPDDSPEITG